MRQILSKRFFSCAVALVLGYVGWKYPSPFFFKARGVIPFASFTLGSVLSLGLAFSPNLGRPARPWFDRALILGLLAGACLPLVQREKIEYQKGEVLSADPTSLSKLGRHFIVGFDDFEEVKNLVGHGAIGGIFLTTHNIEGKSAEQLREEILELQRIQSSLGLPPLWVATDQEGGLVSKLSPLVRMQPGLSTLVDDSGGDPQGLAEAVRNYAQAQAEDLKSLGVNLNFSPVVDLKPPTHSLFRDRHTRIDLRAISADPETVSAVAGEYCKTLRASGIMPTLKHFPGLASVPDDTHLGLGKAARSVAQLRASDWKPFQEVLAGNESFLMLGHVLLPELDENYPVSLSRKVIQKLLRREWGFQGVLVTDDFSMGPIAEAKGGVGKAAVTALNAGVDLLLISYDGDLYYPAMLALLQAQQRGELAEGFLEESEARLRGSSGDLGGTVSTASGITAGDSERH